MPDCQCDRLGRLFDSKVAERDLRDYRERGPDRSTRLLIDALRTTPVKGLTLLDVGGGIGAVQLELLDDGLAAATDVDVSEAYVSVARQAAEERGFGDRASHRVGDFVALASEVDMADIVTLDRVICCYPDLAALAARAAGHARQRLGVVHPHDRWWMRWGAAVLNLVGGPFGYPRFFVHRTARLEAILAEGGLERETATGTLMWRVAVYRRAKPSAAGAAS